MMKISEIETGAFWKILGAGVTPIRYFNKVFRDSSGSNYPKYFDEGSIVFIVSHKVVEFTNYGKKLEIIFILEGKIGFMYIQTFTDNVSINNFFMERYEA